MSVNPVLTIDSEYYAIIPGTREEYSVERVRLISVTDHTVEVAKLDHLTGFFDEKLSVDRYARNSGSKYDIIFLEQIEA